MSKVKEVTKSAALIEFEAKHGEGRVKVIELANNNGGSLTVHVKMPDRRDLSNFQVWIDKDAGKANKLVLDRCLLDNHEALNADDEMYVACGLALATLMPIGSFEIKN